MKKILVLLLGIFPLTSFAQFDTIQLDSINFLIIEKFESGETKSEIAYHYDFYIDTISRINPVTLQQEHEISSGYGYEKYGSEFHWNKAGQLTLSGQNIHSYKVGRWISYHENGSRKLVQHYYMGKLQRKYVAFNQAGVTIEKGTYKNGFREGQWEEFFESGELSAKGLYEIVPPITDTVKSSDSSWIYFTPLPSEWAKNDTWIVYNKDGTIKEKIYYHYGEIKNGKQNSTKSN